MVWHYTNVNSIQLATDAFVDWAGDIDGNPDLVVQWKGLQLPAHGAVLWADWCFDGFHFALFSSTGVVLDQTTSPGIGGTLAGIGLVIWVATETIGGQGLVFVVGLLETS